MMEEITGYADRGGSDRVRANEEYGHSAGVWLRQTICKYLRRSRLEKSLNVFQLGFKLLTQRGAE
jgi:hypothetical protein